MNEIANRVEVSRAPARIHLKKLESGGIVRSWVALVEGEARVLRYYRLQGFDIPESASFLLSSYSHHFRHRRLQENKLSRGLNKHGLVRYPRTNIACSHFQHTGRLGVEIRREAGSQEGRHRLLLD